MLADESLLHTINFCLSETLIQIKNHTTAGFLLHAFIDYMLMEYDHAEQAAVFWTEHFPALGLTRLLH